MKGNHNSRHYPYLHLPIVFNKSKIQNERKSQRTLTELRNYLIVFNKSKIQNERKSQQNGVGRIKPANCVQQVKDTK